VDVALSCVEDRGPEGGWTVRLTVRALGPVGTVVFELLAPASWELAPAERSWTRTLETGDALVKELEISGSEPGGGTLAVLIRCPSLGMSRQSFLTLGSTPPGPPVANATDGCGRPALIQPAK
jgi:hypothetical protein